MKHLSGMISSLSSSPFLNHYCLAFSNLIVVSQKFAQKIIVPRIRLRAYLRDLPLHYCKQKTWAARYFVDQLYYHLMAGYLCRYVMDELGSAMRHSDIPNFRIAPFLFMPEGKLASSIRYCTLKITFSVTELFSNRGLYPISINKNGNTSVRAPSGREEGGMRGKVYRTRPILT